jgi:hypothetical protein
LNFQGQNFARLAFGVDLERAAAYFAIRRKPLRRGAGVNYQVEALAAVGASDGFAGFHIRILQRLHSPELDEMQTVVIGIARQSEK